MFKFTQNGECVGFWDSGEWVVVEKKSQKIITPYGCRIVEGFEVIENSDDLHLIGRFFENLNYLREEVFRTHVHTPVQVPQVVPVSSESSA